MIKVRFTRYLSMNHTMYPDDYYVWLWEQFMFIVWLTLVTRALVAVIVRVHIVMRWRRGTLSAASLRCLPTHNFPSSLSLLLSWSPPPYYWRHHRYHRPCSSGALTYRESDTSSLYALQTGRRKGWPRGVSFKLIRPKRECGRNGGAYHTFLSLFPPALPSLFSFLPISPRSYILPSSPQLIPAHVPSLSSLSPASLPLSTTNPLPPIFHFFIAQRIERRGRRIAVRNGAFLT